MSKPQCESNEMCPLMKSKRSLVCHKCAWYIHIRGTHPQSGDPMDKWECSVALLPMLMIETGRLTNATNDAIISMRNEFVNGTDKRITADLARTTALIKATGRS